MVGVVAEGVADLADGRVDAVLGVDEDLAFPKVVSYFVAADEPAVGGREENEELERFALEAQGQTLAAQLEALAVKLELAELEHGVRYRHGFPAR